MVDYCIMNVFVGVWLVVIDEGLWVYMNKVYVIMLVGILLIFLVVWVFGLNDVLLLILCDLLIL